MHKSWMNAWRKEGMHELINDNNNERMNAWVHEQMHE